MLFSMTKKPTMAIGRAIRRKSVELSRLRCKAVEVLGSAGDGAAEDGGSSLAL
jgi:hypothetical protein